MRTNRAMLAGVMMDEYTCTALATTSSWCRDAFKLRKRVPICDAIALGAVQFLPAANASNLDSVPLGLTTMALDVSSTRGLTISRRRPLTTGAGAAPPGAVAPWGPTPSGPPCAAGAVRAS